MADQPTFEHALEEDMRKLAAEIQNQRERPELTSASEKEIVKEAIRAFPQLEKRQENSPVAAIPPSPNATSSTSPLPGYAEGAPAEVKLEIEYLMELAVKKGLGSALTEARKSPYFVQDALHDALAGRLYPELQKRGIVK